MASVSVEHNPTTPFPAGSVIEELATLHERLQDGYRWLLDHQGESEKLTAGLERFRDLAIRYSVGLAAWCAEASAADLEELHEWYNQRLAKGWTMPESPAVIEHFHTVLGEYEVVCDGLLGADEVWRELVNRARFIEAVSRPDVQRVVRGVFMTAPSQSEAVAL